MRRTVLLLAACGAAASFAVASTAFAGSRKPSLRLAREHPLVVVGSSFHSGERVKLVVHAARLIVVHARSRHGSFTAHLGVLLMPRCESVRILAVGSRGSRAKLTIRRPSCAPLLSP